MQQHKVDGIELDTIFKKIQTASTQLNKKAHLYTSSYNTYDHDLSQLLQNLLKEKIDSYEIDLTSTITECALSIFDETRLTKILKKQNRRAANAKRYLDLTPQIEKLSCDDKYDLLDMIGNNSLDEIYEFIKQRLNNP